MEHFQRYHELWKKISESQPDLTPDSSFGQLSWGSLDWSDFLLDALALVPTEKRDFAFRRIILDSDFEKLSFNELIGLIHELEKDSSCQ